MNTAKTYCVLYDTLQEHILPLCVRILHLCASDGRKSRIGCSRTNCVLEREPTRTESVVVESEERNELKR